MKDMTGNTEVAPVRGKSRFEERVALREESKRKAAEAAYARSLRNKRDITQRVLIAQNRLAQCNVPAAIQVMQALSSSDLDIYILAERYGKNRKQVLQAFPPPRGSVETAYLAEAGLGSPEDAPKG